MTRVGMVGVGLMGSAFAAHLLRAGVEVTGFDTDPARRRELAARGGHAVGSCAAVARAADLIIISLPTTEAFHDVTDAIAAAAGPDTAVADTSTLALHVKERARDRLADRGVVLLDCPVSGTEQQARDKDVAVYASGDAAALARFAPVFAHCARAWHEVGGFGAGTTLKLIANHLVAVHNAATAEALLLARRAGLDLARTVDLLADGAAMSRVLQVRGPSIAAGDYSPGVQTRVMRKDVALIADLARSQGTGVPLLQAATPLYDAAIAQGRDAQDPACLYEVLARIDARAPQPPGRPEDRAP